LVEILRGQLSLEEVTLDPSRQFLVVDTGPEVLWVWNQFKYGRVQDEIREAALRKTYDLTLLLDTDLPWTPDPLRETPDPAERRELLGIYHDLLGKLGRPYALISGEGRGRMTSALTKVRSLPF